MLDTLSTALQVEHAREEYGLEATHSVQMTMSVMRIRAISGAKTQMEDISAIATKATNFKDLPRVLILTNVQILMEAVLTPVTTLLVHSLVPVQVVWSWILANEVAKTQTSVHRQMVVVNTHASTRISPSTASVGKDTLLRQTKRLVKHYHVQV